MAQVQVDRAQERQARERAAMEAAAEAARVQKERQQAMAQAAAEAIRARQQERIQTLLAVVGVALAVPQMVDKPVAGEFLAWLGVAGGYTQSDLLGVQFGATLAVAFGVALIVRRLARGGRR